MDDLTFLDTFSEQGAGNATLKAVLADGQVCHISDNICPFKFLDKCPLLYHAFEYGALSRLQASIEAPSTSAVISLLRYCYTGSYLSPWAEQAPILLLPHAEIYKMALDFDVPELQLLAHGNFSCQVDVSWYLPNPPQDLLETIRFIYAYFADQQSRQENGLVATLLNYCISKFLSHHLGDSPEFLNLVSEMPDFRQDLCRTNMERNFEDECAFDIIRLSLDTLQAPCGARPTLLASRDLPQEMLFDIPKNPHDDLASQDLSQGMIFNNPMSYHEHLADSVMTAFRGESSTSNSNATYNVFETRSSDISATASTTTLVHRPRNPFSTPQADFEAESSSDEDGFSLVHRSRPLPINTPDEGMSSPEVVPATIDVLAMTGSDYPSDDEWSVVDL